MAEIIQFATGASSYDGPFGGGSPWVAAGMGYVIVTNAGLVVIDGGFAEDGERLCELICSLGGVVDTWILTHPHRDHYRAFHTVCTDEALRERVKIKRIVYRFPEAFKDDEGDGIEHVLAHMDEVLVHSGAERITPVEGDELYSGEVRITILNTPTDEGPTHCSPNELSLVFTAEGPNGKAVFTGDAYESCLEHVYVKYGHCLRADVLQMPHHGLCDTGHRGFYEAVSADTLLIPISAAGHRCMRSDVYGDRTKLVCEMEDGADRVYLAYHGTARIDKKL
ncbi:MAG: MBL fold metallo-hydrolase [Clostridia bacterium]|nr:MBL fold metallo-hydrolase [Clostridia bacterium]